MVCGVLLVGVAMAAGFFGAIFTTTQGGTTVNGNVYENKEDVYLNGGPQNLHANGLPDGDYYFQVTDPSGATLLSTDPAVCRQVTVVGGKLAGAAQASVDAGCAHANGDFDAANNTTPVQLIPYDTTPNAGGEYKAWLIKKAAATVGEGGITLSFSNSDSKTDNFKIRTDPVTPPVVIFGEKFYDTNTNGLHDQGEPVIAGWRIEKQPPNQADVTFTGTNGQYSFIVLPDSGLYTISEVPPPPGWYPAIGATWLNTTAKSGDVTVGNADIQGPVFGNVCLGPGGGLTLGFWSNKNGQALFGSDDLALMVALNLRSANGTAFNPTSYSGFRSWILSATATNMAYMLSAQLAAMELNVLNGNVTGGSLIYAPGTTSANGAGFATVSAVMAEANTELGVHGLTVASGATRTYQEKLKIALDKANNSLTFVQSGPCAFASPYGSQQ
ncbi:MAG: hypothetical protein M3O85_08975 [Acidobacteriota bacterium]|nr:hypothetical protein [Acidobacteriota bacterium]